MKKVQTQDISESTARLLKDFMEHLSSTPIEEWSAVDKTVLKDAWKTAVTAGAKKVDDSFDDVEDSDLFDLVAKNTKEN